MASLFSNIPLKSEILRSFISSPFLICSPIANANSWTSNNAPNQKSNLIDNQNMKSPWHLQYHYNSSYADYQHHSIKFWYSMRWIYATSNGKCRAPLMVEKLAQFCASLSQFSVEKLGSVQNCSSPCPSSNIFLNLTSKCFEILRENLNCKIKIILSQYLKMWGIKCGIYLHGRWWCIIYDNWKINLNIQKSANILVEKRITGGCTFAIYPNLTKHNNLHRT